MEKRKPDVLDVEIIEPDSNGQRHDCQGEYGARWSQRGFSGFWTASPINTGGCVVPAITFALFMVCLGQFGLLAAIGFFVFHVIGAIMGSLYQARQLMAGIPYDPWAWRAGNWVVSFSITMWLAGGIGD